MPIAKQNNVDAARQREISKSDSLRGCKSAAIDVDDENHYEPEPFGGSAAAAAQSGLYAGLNNKAGSTSTPKSFESMKSTPPADSDLFKY